MWPRTIADMPHLDGARVRHRAAQLGLSVAQLAARSGLAHSTVRNALGGQSLHLVRCYRVLRALNPPGARPTLALADILCAPDTDDATVDTDDADGSGGTTTHGAAADVADLRGSA